MGEKGPHKSNILTRFENIIIHLLGVKSIVKNKTLHLQCFELFIADDVIDDIVN